MTIHHATIWLGSGRARILHFEEQRFPVRRFKKTTELRTEASIDADPTRLFGDVCAAIEGVPQLLLTGTAEAIVEFERHARVAHPRIASRILGVQRVDNPTDGRLSALACWHFTVPAAMRR